MEHDNEPAWAGLFKFVQRRRKVMFNGEYGSWTIEGSRAFLKADEKIGINLYSNLESGVMEGWWKEPVHGLDAVSGICIFDARWSLELDNGNDAGAHKSLAMPREREKALKMIKKGRRIKTLFVPIEPSAYHTKLIKWQAQKICQLSARRILYHLPLDEYHIFIQELESASGQKMPKMHDLLEEFSEKIRMLFLKTLKDQGGDCGKVEFINPLAMGAETTDDSFGYPYLFPEKFGCSFDKMMGIEDLVELRILLRVQAEMGYVIPAICSVIGVPHPYLTKKEVETELQTVGV